MEIINGIIGGGLLAILGVIAFILLVLAAIYYKLRYKVAEADEALVITGGKKEAKILPGGGAFVPPNRKATLFPISVMTVRGEGQETQTSTMVPVVVSWTAQIRADIEPESIQKAVRGFGGDKPDAIMTSLRNTLDGEVRSVVATMTPEQVVSDKVGLAGQVTTGVADRMTELGYLLVSLNISEVTDNGGYYRNLAAEDREERRQKAETLTAQANQTIAVEQAAADRTSQEAELNRDLAIAEKTREVDLRKSAIRVETDTAAANAEVAKDLQTEIRNKEIETRKGEVAVVKAQQDQAAAIAEREADLTRAETTKRRQEIEAAASKRTAEIDAESKAAVAKATAAGKAEADKAEAIGEAEALKVTTAARANELREIGEAEASAIKAKGEAEASSIKAKGEAEAEVQRKMAEALAANDGANLRITLAEIQRDTTVKVYSTVGEAMAHIGENATFIDMGGGSQGGSDLLSNVLGNIPELLKQLDVKSDALNGAPFGESLGNLAAAVSEKLFASNGSTTETPSFTSVDTNDATAASNDSSTNTVDEPLEEIKVLAEDAGVTIINPGDSDDSTTFEKD